MPPELPRQVRGYFQRRDGQRSPVVSLAVASTLEAQSKGLSGRGALTRHHGMLFAFTEYGHHGFWMKDTYVPLDIAWMDAEGQVLEVHRLTPLDLTMHRPKRQAKYAVELNAGAFEAYGVEPGDRLVIIEKRGT